MPYGYHDIVDAYRRIGVGPGKVVYAASDILRVADYEERGSTPLMEAHYRALREVLGPEGTLVVPTASTQLCNSDTPFHPAETPSFRVGSFSEYVRTRPETLRSFHPFTSYSAVGLRAAEITSNVSRHAFGPETPMARMIDRDAMAVCIGILPNWSCSAVHHVEQVVGVPYRYIKEFVHPVVRGDEVLHEPFYMHVWYREIDMKRNHNERLFAKLRDKMEIREGELGFGKVYGYSLEEFYSHACRIFADDIYIWWETPPSARPYSR